MQFIFILQQFVFKIEKIFEFFTIIVINLVKWIHFTGRCDILTYQRYAVLYTQTRKIFIDNLFYKFKSVDEKFTEFTWDIIIFPYNVLMNTSI